MSLLIFFGGVTLVILIGLGVVLHGCRHHYLEAKKKAPTSGASVSSSVSSKVPGR